MSERTDEQAVTIPPPAHTHNGKGTYPHCRGCGTAYCKTCDAYGNHLSTEPHPRTRHTGGDS